MTESKQMSMVKRAYQESHVEKREKMIRSIPGLTEWQRKYLLKRMVKAGWHEMMAAGVPTNFDINSTNHVEAANSILSADRLREKDFYSFLRGALEAMSNQLEKLELQRKVALDGKDDLCILDMYQDQMKNAANLIKKDVTAWAVKFLSPFN